MTRRIGFKGRIAAVAAVAGFLVLAGTGAGWAYWTGQSTAQVTTTAADLTITTTNFGSLAKTFTNDSLTHTGSVIVTNTTAGASPQKGIVTLTFSGTGQTAAFRSNFATVVWLSTVANPCTGTPGTALVTSSWGASASYTTPGADAFSVGETRTYCVRTTIADRETVATASGTASFTPQIAGSIVVANFTGSASATTTQLTSNIFTPSPPATSTSTYYWMRPNVTSAGYPTYCADVNGGTAGDGTTIIAYGCKTAGATNQQWRFNTIPGRANYLTISTRQNAAFFLDGTDGTLRTRPTSGLAGQIWQVQLISGSNYQLVNDATGLCLQTPTGTTQNLGDITLVACANTAVQQFILSRIATAVSCSYANPTYSVPLTAGPSTTYTLRIAGTVRDTETTNAAGTTTLAFSRTAIADGTYVAEVYNAAGTRVAYGSVTRGGTAGSTTNTCSMADML